MLGNRGPAAKDGCFLTRDEEMCGYSGTGETGPAQLGPQVDRCLTRGGRR